MVVWLTEPWKEAVRWGGAGKEVVLWEEEELETYFLGRSPSDGECLGPLILCSLCTILHVYKTKQNPTHKVKVKCYTNWGMPMTLSVVSTVHGILLFIACC